MTPKMQILLIRVTRQSNEALGEAINARLGTEDWAMSDIVERLQLQELEDGAERVYLDGMLILELGPVEVSWAGRDPRMSRRIEQFQPLLGESVH